MLYHKCKHSCHDVCDIVLVEVSQMSYMSADGHLLLMEDSDMKMSILNNWIFMENKNHGNPWNRYVFSNDFSYRLMEWTGLTGIIYLFYELLLDHVVEYRVLSQGDNLIICHFFTSFYTQNCMWKRKKLFHTKGFSTGSKQIQIITRLKTLFDAELDNINIFISALTCNNSEHDTYKGISQDFFIAVTSVLTQARKCSIPHKIINSKKGKPGWYYYWFHKHMFLNSFW